MSIFTKHRFEIWSLSQHPLKHTLSDFAYTNPALPGVTDTNSALNWVFKVLYPNDKPAVANPAALPLIGNTLNDYRVVTDDGDGNPAGYRWEQREGEVSASWHKVFDFDWSTDSILAAYMDITQDLYVYKAGKSDLDAAGAVVTGTYAGQTIYGGNLATQNLTLRANSGDGTGAHTGYVQADDNFRPAVGFVYDLGTLAEKWKDFYMSGTAKIGNLTLSSASISDLNGVINFSDNDLVSTNGDLTISNGFFITKIEVGPLAGNALILQPGSITDESGAISFGNENLTTTGTLTAASGSQLADFTFTTGSIVSVTATISFGTNNLSTTGTGNFGDTQVTRLDSDNIRIDGNTISILNLNGNLIFQANGTGVIDLQSAATTLGISATGVVTVTGQLNADNLRLDGNVISSTDLNGNITFTPNGTGIVETSAHFKPASDNTLDLGDSTHRFNDLFMAGTINDGTTSISSATIQSFRNANVGVTTGMSLFYNSVSGCWEPSLPDTEITHSGLSGLTTGDAGHTQFVMLAGRAGGQTIQGGTAAGEHLVLESTANASKGLVKTKDNFVAFTNASFAVTWSGTDIGGSSNYFRDVYTKGEFRGLRIENFTTAGLPSPSGQNVGRVVFDTDVFSVYIDTGTTLKKVGQNTFISDTSWNGTDVTKDVTVSSTIGDARNAIWQLCDNANDFERIYTNIRAISATQVRIAVSPALPAGSYRLLGIEM